MKKERKHMILSVLLVLMLVVLTACGKGSSNTPQQPGTNGGPEASDEKAEVRFTMNMSYSGILYDTLMNEIAEKVSEYSDGRITAQIIAAGTMGSERELIEGLQYGTIDMAYISDLTIDGLVDGIGWMSLPFMFDNYEEANAIFDKGWMRELITEKMVEIDVIPVSVLINGFNQFASSTAPVESLKDFEGQKVRVPETKALVEFYKACGALPVAMPGSEVLSALEQGTIDAVNNTLYNYNQNGYIDAFKYITMTNHMYSSCTMSASSSFWNSLSEEDQAIIKRATDEACENYTNAILEGEKRVREEYESKGMVFIDPSEEFKEELNAVRDKLIEILGKDSDPEVLERIKKEIYGL